jgi:hypothetical protein
VVPPTSTPNITDVIRPYADGPFSSAFSEMAEVGETNPQCCRRAPRG